MKVIFINGPPRSGKDAAGNALATILKGETFKFAHALKCGTHALFAAMRGIRLDMTSIEDFASDATNDAAFEAVKDKSSPEFFGLSPREAYIAVSETLLKPTFGDKFFGAVLMRRLAQDQPGVAIITDSGFVGEAQVIIDAVGADNCKLLRMHRDGCDFSNDSRGYIDLPGVDCHDVDNNGNLALLGLTLSRLNLWSEKHCTDDETRPS